MKKLILALTSAALLLGISTLPALAAPSFHTNFGEELNASQCNTTNNPIVNVTFKVLNDDDSGVAGNAWALDNNTKSVKVWTQQDGTYCAIVNFQGQFTTFAGPSPDNTGTVAAGVTGTFEGGYQANFDGIFTPTKSTKGNLGTFDYQCDQSFNCPGYFDWVAAYFTGNTYFNQPYWAWNYHAGNNGSWVNASTGNLGDITGN